MIFGLYEESFAAFLGRAEVVGMTKVLFVEEAEDAVLSGAAGGWKEEGEESGAKGLRGSGFESVWPAVAIGGVICT